MAIKLKDLTPIYSFYGLIYYYKETHNGSMMYYANREGVGRPYKVRAREVIKNLYNTNARIIR